MELVIVSIEVLTHLKFYLTGIICGCFVSSDVFVFLYRHIISVYYKANLLVDPLYTYYIFHIFSIEFIDIHEYAN